MTSKRITRTAGGGGRAGLRGFIWNQLPESPRSFRPVTQENFGRGGGVNTFERRKLARTAHHYTTKKSKKVRQKPKKEKGPLSWITQKSRPKRRV